MTAKHCIGCGKKRPTRWRGDKGNQWVGTQPMEGPAASRFSYWSCGCIDPAELVRQAIALSRQGKRYPDGLELKED